MSWQFWCIYYLYFYPLFLCALMYTIWVIKDIGNPVKTYKNNTYRYQTMMMLSIIPIVNICLLIITLILSIKKSK